MNSQSVQVTIRLGHTAQLRKKPTLEGFTHDWKVFVRGPEGGNIQNFVEKVVFYLHESFPKFKRVVKEPPYEVSESGYAGFELLIDIYFKSKSEPRKIRFNYDLFLQLSDSPPVHHIRCEKLTFQNPLDDFRQRLLLSGGVLAGGGSEHGKSESASSKSHTIKSQKSSETIDSKPEPPKPAPPIVSKVFTDLFGSPLTKEDITTSKKTASKPAAFASKEKKEKERDKSFSSHSKTSVGKGGTTSNLSTPSPATPPTGKDKHSSLSSSHKHKDKHDKDKQKHSKDKDKSSNKRTVESPPSAEELSSKKKKRTDSADKSSPESKSKDKEKSYKSVTVKNEKDSKEVQGSSSKHSSHKNKSSKRDKSETEIKEVKKEKDGNHESKSKHHKHDKHDKEKKHSKDKERHHKDSPSSKSLKKEDLCKSPAKSQKDLCKSPAKSQKDLCKSPAKSQKDLCKSPAKSQKIAKGSDKNTKKPSPQSNKLLPFMDELSTGELSDFDPFSENKPSKGSPGSSTQSFNSPKTGCISHGIGSFIDKSDSSDSDSDLLSPLDEKSPANIFSQHTPKASPSKSPATHSDRATPTPQGFSRKQSPSSQKAHNTSKLAKSKYKDKDTNASTSKKVKLERKPSKEGKSAMSSNVDSDSLKYRNNDMNSLSHLEKTTPGDRLQKDMNSLPDLGSNGHHQEIDAPNGESLSVLVELQQRLMTANDNTLLRRVVDLIEETGQFKIDDNMFNFDLCNLDRITVQKLQTCLLTT